MTNFDAYLDILSLKTELININEMEFAQVISKLTPEKKVKTLVKNIKQNVNEKNPVESMKKIKKITNIIPPVKLKAIDKFYSSKVDDYMQLKKIAHAVLKNSLPKHNKKLTDIASTFLALSSFVKKKNKPDVDPQVNLKKNIKEFVSKVRNFADDFTDEEPTKKRHLEKEDLPDLAVAWTIVAMISSIAVSLTYGTIMIFNAMLPLFTPVFFIVSLLVIIMIVLSAVYTRGQ